jgi:hypothetical protein
MKRKGVAEWAVDIRPRNELKRSCTETDECNKD